MTSMPPASMLTHLSTAGSKLIRPYVATMSPQTNRRSTDHSQLDKDAFAFPFKGMQKARRAALPVFITSAALGGCASHGAPSFVLFGAFFPAWMLCAIIGIFGAIAARGIFVVAELDSVLPFQLFVCSSVGLVIATLTWLIWFGQ
jgi:YtcA family